MIYELMISMPQKPKQSSFDILLEKELSNKILKDLQNELGKKYNVQIQQVVSKGVLVLCIRGDNCRTASKEIQQIVSTIQHLPDNWINVVIQKVQKANFAMHEIAQNSKEFRDIQTFMHETTPQAVIKSVHVLQNFELWKKFMIEKDIL